MASSWEEDPIVGSKIEQTPAPSEWEEDAIAETTGAPSKWDQFMYGVASMPGMGDALDAYLERKLLTGHIQFLDEEGSWQIPEYVPPTDKLRKAVEEGVYGDDEWSSDPTVEDPAILAQRDETQARLAAFKPEVHGTEYADTGVATLGKFAGALADPSTALPVGATVRGAVGIGAAVGAVDMATYQLATEGKVDIDTVALGAALGGTAGGLLKKGGDAFGNWLHGKRENNVPVTEKDIQEQLIKYDVKDADPRILAEQINTNLGIGVKSNQVARRKQARAAWKENPEDAAFWQRYGETQAELRELDGQVINKETEKLAETKKAEIEDMYKQRALDVEESVRKLEQEHVSQQRKVIQQRNKAHLALADIPEQPVLGTQMEKALESAQAAVKKDEQAIESVKQIFNQGGGISQDVLYNMASTGTGAGLGYMWDGEQGAAIGAAIGLGLPWMSGKTYSKLGRIGERDASFITDNMASLATRPTTKLNTLGSWGQVFSKRLSRAIEDIDLQTADKMWLVESKLANLSDEGKQYLIKGMQGVIKDSNQTPEIREILTTIRKEFSDVLKEARKVGVISPQKAAELANKAKTSGYWPRMYNEAFLSSSEGKAKWQEIFSTPKWSKETLQNTLETILGTGSKDVPLFMSLAKKSGNNYYMPPDQALRILEKRGVVMKSKRSSHLEHSRRINVDEEDMLNPVLVADPHAVLSSYFHDVYRRIEMARTFGAADEIAVKAINEIEKEFGGADAKYVRDLYFTAVGSSRAPSVAAGIAMKEGLKRAYGTINAFETLKLSMAQTINAGQALVNGTTYLAGRTNPVTTYKIATKALFNSFGKEGKDIAARSGAAVEATLLQLLGEYSEASSILGKQLRGVLSPLEILNNPTEFLKFTQFIRVEKFQRVFAANMGNAYAEHLLAKKALIDSGELVGKEAKKILNQMEEIGLSTHVPADKVPEGDMLRASLRFSNEVNFRNTADKYPLAWHSPHAKVFTKFKSFAFHHGAFIKDNVYKPLKEGNPAPLINYLAVGTPLGMGVDELRRLIKGDDRELTVSERLLRGFSSVGGLGILVETIASTAYSAASPVMSIAGPAVADAANLLHGVWNSIAEQSAKPVARAVVQTQVFPGKKLLMEELKSDLHKKARRRTRSTAAKRKRVTR